MEATEARITELTGRHGRASIGRLIEFLGSGDWRLRCAAARALTRLAQEQPTAELRLALPPLRNLLQSWAYEWEGGHDPYRAAYETIRSLPTQLPEAAEVRDAAAGGVLPEDGMPVESLARALVHEDAVIRYRAVRALIRRGEVAVGAVCPLLSCDNYRDAELACWIVGEIGSPTALPPLRAALHQEDERRVQAALIALAQILAATGDPASLDELRDLLRGARPSHQARMIRALGDARYARAAPVLAACFSRHAHSAVRAEAAWVLGLIGDPTAIQALRNGGDDIDPGVRFQALNSVALIGGPEAVATLTDYLEEPDDSTRVMAANALAMLAERQPTRALHRATSVLRRLVRTSRLRWLDPNARALSRALRRIDEALGHPGNLPIPSRRRGEAQDLPRPAGADAWGSARAEQSDQRNAAGGTS